MPRRAVEFEAGHCYHLYNRGVNRQPIFFERENYVFFLRRLREHFSADAVSILAYCLLPNHYHLLVQLKTDDLAGIIGPFNLSYAKAINKRYNRVGPLFQGRFEGKWVDRDEYLLHLSRYIHLNPVMAGLAKTPEEWEFSSYQDYIGLRQGTLPQPGMVLNLLELVDIPGIFKMPGMSRVSVQESYRRYVETWRETDSAIVKHLLFDV